MNRIFFFVIVVLAGSIMGPRGEAHAQGASVGTGQSGKPPSPPSAQQRMGEVDKCIKDTGQAFADLFDVLHAIPATFGSPRSSQGCVGNAARCLTDRQQKVDAFTKQALREFLGTEVMLPPSAGGSTDCVTFKNNVRIAFLGPLLTQLNELRKQYGLPPLADPSKSAPGQR
jgi:hypothetical protein